MISLKYIAGIVLILGGSVFTGCIVHDHRPGRTVVVRPARTVVVRPARVRPTRVVVVKQPKAKKVYMGKPGRGPKHR